MQETWQAFEELPSTGLTKAIGVCNMSIQKLEDVFDYAKIIPAVNQACRCHIRLQQLPA